MAGNHRPDYLFVRPLFLRARFTGVTWKCWVAMVDAFQDYSPPCNGTYARRQGPATIAFNGELYWDDSGHRLGFRAK
jgi:hypothetical protein